MQDEKEIFKEFMKITKEKVHDWWVSYNRKLWTARIFVYSIFLLLVISVGAILFAKFNLFHTNADSARYMLSAMVQSQAAIVAIVITLTLIAVQLTASAYSPRVIDVFKKNPDMWILLGCYGVSIFYGFIVLKLVEGTEGEFVSQSAIWSLGSVSISFEFYVSLAYWLGAFTFVSLFPYMRNVISLLKSENVIKRLAVEITKDNILSLKDLEEDPILPVVDIIHVSIMKYDLETTRIGLKAVTDQGIKVTSSVGGGEIPRHFCNHLFRVSRLAIGKMDEESTIEVIKNLKNFGKSTKYAAAEAAESLGFVGKAAAEKGLKYAAAEAVESLGFVGTGAAEKGLGNATKQAVESLKRVGRAAAEKGLEYVVEQAVKFLGSIAFIAFRIAVTEKGFGYVASQAVESLGFVGTVAAEKGLENATKQAVESLGFVGTVAVEKGLEGATGQTAKSLAELTILSEEIVKTSIQDYESKLEGKDQASFQEFMKIYEQELKKLRAEKNQNKKTKGM